MDEYVNGRCVGEPVIEPCPYCGCKCTVGVVVRTFGEQKLIECSCGYQTRFYDSADTAIMRHNAIAEFQSEVELARSALKGLIPWVEWARSKLEDSARMGVHKCDGALYAEKVRQVDAALDAARKAMK